MSMPEPNDAERLSRILDRLIERTEAGQIAWEAGAPPDSYAVTIADVRFRIRTRDANGQAPHVLDIMGQAPEVVASDLGVVSSRNVQLERLYAVARRNVAERAADQLGSVEQQLGLAEPSQGDG